MRYLGGKKRQSKEIVKAVESLSNVAGAYVEPFCGAMWSAVAVAKRFPQWRYYLNDANPYLMSFWTAAIKDRWNPPRVVTEDDYNTYKKERPVDDPMTGYLGFACSFAGKFFGGWARDTAGKRNFSREISKASLEKLAVLRCVHTVITCGDYMGTTVPLGSVVYCDPPYENRTKQSNTFSFDAAAYCAWAEHQSRRACVIATEFVNARGWPVLHDWGDTVVRHLNSNGRDGTSELLLRVKHV